MIVSEPIREIKERTHCCWFARFARPCLTVAIFVVGSEPIAADSIWQRRDPEHAYLFIDAQARRVGDLLTVMISQNTDVQNREDRGMSKSSSVEEGFSLSAAANGGFSQQGGSATLDVGNQASREFQGEAAYTSERTFQDRFTVSVVDILPNGNLVVSGRRRVWVAGDETVLVLTGVVREVDIGPANTVPSHFVSDLNISYESNGPERRFTRQGWLSRRLNRFYPF